MLKTFSSSSTRILCRTLCPGTSSGPSKLDQLSQLVMDKTALNEMDSTDEGNFSELRSGVKLKERISIPVRQLLSCYNILINTNASCFYTSQT